MKILFFSFSLFGFCFFASAEIPVGTYVIQDQVQIKPDGTTIERQIKMSVISINIDQKLISLRSENLQDGTVNDILDLPISEDSILTTDMGKHIVENCLTEGGVLEMVSVPAGEFETCRLQSDDENAISTIWIGAVPFGWVKQSILWHATGNHNSFELSEIGLN